jgi:hypothetical protein
MECCWLHCCRPARQVPAVAESAERIKWPPRQRPGAPHTIVVIRRVLRQCTTPTPCFGARPVKRLLQARLQSQNISRTLESARMQESPSANSTFGFTATLRSTRVTTRSLTFEMGRKYRFLRVSLWCSAIETENGLLWLTIHRGSRNHLARWSPLPSNLSWSGRAASAAASSTLITARRSTIVILKNQTNA